MAHNSNISNPKKASFDYSKKIFDYSFDDLLAYLKSKDSAMSALIFEITGLDNLLSLYKPNNISRKKNAILHTISQSLPKEAVIFQISTNIFFILYNDTKEILDIANHIKTIISKPESSYDSDISFCIGVAYGKANTIIAKSFYALKNAKKHLSKIYFLDIKDSHFKRIQKEEKTINAIVKDSIQNAKVQTFYQPIFDNTLRKITKFECLSRLVDDDTMLYPIDFFDIARQKDMIGDIAYLVIDNSFKVFQHNQYDFSINITEENIHDAKMIDYLNNQCKKYHINPSRIILEILEDVEICDNDLLLRHIFMLKDMGFKIAIDDFGYANSNFGRLIKMQIDYIKIDGHFIKNITTDSMSYKIVKSIVNFAKTINVKCVAEYVHSKAIQDMIETLGIEYSQGYYIGEATSKLLSEVTH